MKGRVCDLGDLPLPDSKTMQRRACDFADFTAAGAKTVKSGLYKFVSDLPDTKTVKQRLRDLAGGPQFKGRGTKKYARRLGLTTAQSVATTGAAALSCSKVFGVGTVMGTGWHLLAMAAVVGGSAAVTFIVPITTTDRDGHRYTENPWTRVLAHQCVCLGTGMTLTPLVVFAPARLLMRVGLTGGVSLAMVAYSLTRPPEDLMQWAPVLSCCMSGLMMVCGGFLLPFSLDVANGSGPSGLMLVALLATMGPRFLMLPRFIYRMVGVPLYTAMIGFSVSRDVYKAETMGMVDHLGDALEIYFYLYNLLLLVA